MAGVAIIGSGWGVNVQVPAFTAAGLKIVALSGRDAAKSAALAAQHGVPFSSSSLAEVLARPDVQLVSVVTPPALHAAQAIAALRAGKHVLCEKPFALNAAEARAVYRAWHEAVAAHNRPLLGLLDHELRFHSSLQRVRDFVHAGGLGRLSHAHATFIGTMPAVLAPHWSWWSDASQGGGVLMAVASHYVDLLSWLTHSEAGGVAATLRTVESPKLDAESGQMKEVTSDDHVEMQMRMASGTSAERASFFGGAGALPQAFHARVSLMVASYGHRHNDVLLLGEKGAVRIDVGSMTAVYTPANRQHPTGLPATEAAAADSQPITWTSDAPAEIAGLKTGAYHGISPYMRGTVCIGQRVREAIEQLGKQQQAQASTPASDVPASAAASLASSTSSSLATLPPSLLGHAASFADGVYVQTVLDRARDSHAAGGGFVDVRVEL